jgi:hypothetical protein
MRSDAKTDPDEVVLNKSDAGSDVLLTVPETMDTIEAASEKLDDVIAPEKLMVPKVSPSTTGAGSALVPLAFPSCRVGPSADPQVLPEINVGIPSDEADVCVNGLPEATLLNTVKLELLPANVELSSPMQTDPFGKIANGVASGFAESSTTSAFPLPVCVILTASVDELAEMTADGTFRPPF